MDIRTKLVSFGDSLYYQTLEKELTGMKSVLDLGCGGKSPLAKVKKTFYSVGFDIFKKSIEKSKKVHIHDAYKQGDVMKIDTYFKKKSFDCVVALDLIEHLPKRDGFALLKKMETLARKKVIVLTPNGFYKQEPYEENPFQMHKSGWVLEDFTMQGYKSFGMRGIKYLRGEYATITLRPWIVWAAISVLSQPFFYFLPSMSYQLLAIKKL